MRQGMQSSLIMLGLALVSVACTAQEKVTLVYKAKAGQVARYKSEAHLTLEAQGMKLTIEQKQTEKLTITEVAANGNISQERIAEELEVTVNGMKTPSPESDKTKSTITFGPDGTLLAYKSADEEEGKIGSRLHVATNIIFPNKPLGVGDKWSSEVKANADQNLVAGKAEYEVLGFEKTNGMDTVKIQMTYQEAEGNPPLRSKGIYWVEQTTGDSILSDVDIENVPFGPAGMQALGSGKVHQERIAGSPLGEVKSDTTKPQGGTPKPTDPKNPPKETKPEPKKEKTIDETIKDFEKLPGLFTLYRKKEAGRETIYLELKEEQLDKLVMMEVTASTGTADQMVAGTPIDDIVFKFSKMTDDKVFMVVPNYNFRAPDKTPIGRSLRRSFADGYLESFKIEAQQPDRKSLLLNVSDLFRGDIAQISQSLGGGSLFGRGGGFSLDREKTFIASVKNFPENLVVETAYHFTKSGGGGGLAALLGGGSNTLADPRSAPFKVNYTVFMLPEGGYQPRLADPRVGYFQTEYQDIGNDSNVDPNVRFILRWDLEKADPKAALSPPKKPVVFWLDNAIPLEYRDAVREGLLFWNKAYEKVGIKDAIVVKQMPDNADWDHADMRYNTIRWVTSPDGGYAVALFRVNPLTGQILNANITVDAGLVHFGKMQHREIVDPASYFQKMIDPQPNLSLLNIRRCDMAKEAMEQAWFGDMALRMMSPNYSQKDRKAYIHSFLRMIVSHEMGHIQGLRHNFIASTQYDLDELKDENNIKKNGISASVMDYIPWNISALKTKGVDYYQDTIGPYDYWAIKYGYSAIDSKTPEGERYALSQIAAHSNDPGHAYQSDEIADSFDPSVVRFDLGKDPLAYWTKTLQVARHLLFHLGERVPQKGQSYWEFTRDFNGLLGLYSRGASVAGRYVGGLHVNRNHKGDAGEKPTLVPIDSIHQKQALKLILDYVFAPNAFAFPKSYFTHLTVDPNGSMIQSILGGTSQDFPIRDTLAGIQNSAMRYLFSGGVMKRIANNEFKMEDTSSALTLPYLFHSVRNAAWAELDSHQTIGNLRRQLQRTHLETLIRMVVSSGAGVPEDARMLAWNELRQLKAKLSQAQGSGDEYTRIHVEESLMRINRTLEAKVMIGGAAPAAGPSLLELLLGGATPQATK